MTLTPPKRTELSENEADILREIETFFSVYSFGDPVDSKDYLIWKLISENDSLRAYINEAIKAPVQNMEIELPDDVTYSSWWFENLLVELHAATRRWGHITYDRNRNVIKVRI
jgi:hypothetical protein